MDYGFGAGEFLKYIEDDFTTFGFEPNKSAGEFAAKKLSKTQIIDDLNTIENESLHAPSDRTPWWADSRRAL